MSGVRERDKVAGLVDHDPVVRKGYCDQGNRTELGRQALVGMWVSQK